MQLTMRVHSLSLPIGTRSPTAQLYRVDGVKRRKESGWTDRITLHGTDLELGDIVIVTFEKEIDRECRTEPVIPTSDDGRTTENESLLAENERLDNELDLACAQLNGDNQEVARLTTENKSLRAVYEAVCQTNRGSSTWANELDEAIAAVQKENDDEL